MAGTDFVERSPLTQRAVAFAERHHAHQTRDLDDAVPLVKHPVEVACLLHEAGYPNEVVAAGVLHDVLEDTDVEAAELEERFGPQVAQLVMNVSDDPSIEDEAERKAALRRQVAEAGEDAVLVFAADKVSKARELRLRASRRGGFQPGDRDRSSTTRRASRCSPGRSRGIDSWTSSGRSCRRSTPFQFAAIERDRGRAARPTCRPRPGTWTVRARRDADGLVDLSPLTWRPRVGEAASRAGMAPTSRARAETCRVRARRALRSIQEEEVSLLTLGVVLLVLGAVLLAAEAHLPSFGALGIAGVAALVTGAALAVDAAGGGVALVLTVALAIGVGAGALLLYAVRASLPVARARARTGTEALVGQIGVVRQAPAPFGQILVDGALWRARPCWEDDGPLRVGDHVVVERVKGLTLSVRRAEEWELET